MRSRKITLNMVNSIKTDDVLTNEQVLRKTISEITMIIFDNVPEPLQTEWRENNMPSKILDLVVERALNSLE